MMYLFLMKKNYTNKFLKKNLKPQQLRRGFFCFFFVCLLFFAYYFLTTAFAMRLKIRPKKQPTANVTTTSIIILPKSNEVIIKYG